MATKSKKKIAVLELETQGLTNREVSLLLEELVRTEPLKLRGLLTERQMLSLSAKPMTFESQSVKE